jgi:hypothetical protein
VHEVPRGPWLRVTRRAAGEVACFPAAARQRPAASAEGGFLDMGASADNSRMQLQLAPLRVNGGLANAGMECVGWDVCYRSRLLESGE